MGSKVLYEGPREGFYSLLSFENFCETEGATCVSHANDKGHLSLHFQKGYRGIRKNLRLNYHSSSPSLPVRYARINARGSKGALRKLSGILRVGAYKHLREMLGSPRGNVAIVRTQSLNVLAWTDSLEAGAIKANHLNLTEDEWEYCYPIEKAQSGVGVRYPKETLT